MRLRQFLRRFAIRATLCLTPLAAFAANFNVSTEAELRSALDPRSTNDLGQAQTPGAQNGDTITFTSNITLTGDLPIVQRDITFEGGNFTLNGNHLFRGLFVWSGTVAINNLVIADTLARGGDGGIGAGNFGGGGGGGAGLGGALFVRSGASVATRNVSLIDNSARGGEGSFQISGGDDAGGGGGGMGGTGGDGVRLFSGGGGGLGGGARGGSADGSGAGGIALGLAPGGGPGASGGINGGGGGSMYFTTGGAGGGVLGSTSRAGGFGGGGGGGSGISTGAAGGFGGGGGSGRIQGGNGGFGGGGGGSTAVKSGGFGGGTGQTGRGGGGGGMGGGIFVQESGTLEMRGTLVVHGNSVASGQPGGPDATSGSAIGSGLFLQGNGSLTVAPDSGQTQTIANDIADQTGSWLQVAPPTSSASCTSGRHPCTYSNGNYSSDGRWSLAKNGAGMLVLNGANAMSGGASTVNGGTLRVNHMQALGFGSWTNHATVELGSPLSVTLGSTNNTNGTMPESSFAQSGSGVLKLGITGAGCVHDQLNAKTNLTLGGTLHIAVSSGCVPTSGQSFTVMTANLGAGTPSVGTPSGAFANLIVTGMPPGRTLTASYTGAAVVLTETAGTSAPILNIDNSDPGTTYDPATDGALLVRYLLGFREGALIANARGAGASLRDAATIETYIASNLVNFDVDGDGLTLAHTDGIMILRRLLNPSVSVSNAAAISAIMANAKRGGRSDADVVTAIDALKP